MANSLDRNHPFRASINHQNDPEPRSVPLKAQDLASEVEKESKFDMALRAFLKLSPKTRLLTLLFFGGTISYGYVMIYDAVFGPSQPPSRQFEDQFAAAPPSADVFSGDDEARFREARPSWVARTFCKGVKRSFLCD